MEQKLAEVEDTATAEAYKAHLSADQPAEWDRLVQNSKQELAVLPAAHPGPPAGPCSPSAACARESGDLSSNHNSSTV